MFSGLARVWQIIEILPRRLIYPQQDSGQSLQIQLFFEDIIWTNHVNITIYYEFVYGSLSYVVIKIPFIAEIQNVFLYFIVLHRGY